MREIVNQRSVINELLGGAGPGVSNSRPAVAPEKANAPAKTVNGVGALPVFDAMPANSGRFTFGQQNVAFAEVGIGAEFITVFDTVLPPGYTTDVQWFRCNVTDAIYDVSGTYYYGIPPEGFYISIFLDGIGQIFNQDIFIAPLDGFYPVRIIGEGGQRVTVKARFPYASNTAYVGITTITTITGQMLVTNKEQPQYTGLVQPPIKTQSTD